jgi:hypothetical protein
VLKLLFLTTVALMLFAGPIAALRQPWAVALWRKLRVLLFAYIFVIVLVAVLRLAFNWNDIYG